MYKRASCKDCPFGGAKVGWKGDEASPLVIVGESPGREERKLGKPFMGPSGQVLDETTKRAKSSISPLYTNAITCYPPAADKNLAVLKNACGMCHVSLHEEIKRYPRKVILALGNGALWSLTGMYGLKITQVRGKLFPSPLASVGVVAAVHPAFLLRGGGSYRQFVMDVLYAIDLADGKCTPKEAIKPQYLVHNKASLRALHKLLMNGGERIIAADKETSGFSPRENYVLDIGLAWNPKYVHILPAELMSTLEYKEILEAPHLRWVWHNGKFDVQWDHHLNIQARVDEDTMLQSYTLDENRGIHDLEQVGSDLLGAANYKHVMKPYQGKGKSYAMCPKKTLHPYLAIDVSNTLQIHTIQRDLIRRDPGLEKLYTRTLLPGSKMLARVESTGMQVDVARVEANKVVYEAQSAELERKINEIAIAHIGESINPRFTSDGEFINPRSPKQLAILLFDVLKLPIQHGRSTNVDALEGLPQVPIVKLLLEYRKIQKGLTTYVLTAIENMESDGRVHSTYLLHGTPTGRLASRYPNMQNIPRLAILRGQFVAKCGYVLIEADLNQAELRSLATLSGCKALCLIYETDGMSLHVETSISIFGEDYTDEQKMRAKAVNFGIVYGRTAASLAEEFNVSIEEAQRWINAWFTRFPGATAFIHNCRMAPLRGQNLRTPFGNMKRYGVVSQDKLNDIQNQSANFPHQSIASHCNLHSAIETQDQLLQEFDTNIVNLVHDSIIVEAPNDERTIAWVSRILIDKMEEVPRKWGLTRIPFKADVKVGTRWGKLEKGIPNNDGYLEDYKPPTMQELIAADEALRRAAE